MNRLPDAQSPHHPEQRAKATCPRCGTFVSSPSPGSGLCPACTLRFEGEPLEAAVRWVSRRTSALRIVMGVVSTVSAASLAVFFVFFIMGGRLGGAMAAGLGAVIIGLGRLVSAHLVRALAPNWIAQAQKEFRLPDEFVQELRLVLR